MKNVKKPMKFVAGLAIAGGLAAGAMGISTGVASADVGPGLGPIATWGGPPPPPGPGWGGGGWDRGHGGGNWGPPPPPNYGYGGYNGGGPIPGGWNGGWEPQGGLCLGPFCV